MSPGSFFVSSNHSDAVIASPEDPAPKANESLGVLTGDLPPGEKYVAPTKPMSLPASGLRWPINTVMG